MYLATKIDALDHLAMSMKIGIGFVQFEKIEKYAKLFFVLFYQCLTPAPIINPFESLQCLLSIVCHFLLLLTLPTSDLSPPVIMGCPMNINVTTDLGEDFANVSWRAPQAFDNVELVSLSVSQGPGTQFPVGITSVLYTAVDAANLRDDCSFNVTVVGKLTN